MTGIAQTVREGVLDSVPIFVPAIPFAVVFAVVVGESGIAPWLGWSSSPVIFGGAAVGMIGGAHRALLSCGAGNGGLP